MLARVYPPLLQVPYAHFTRNDAAESSEEGKKKMKEKREKVLFPPPSLLLYPALQTSGSREHPRKVADSPRHREKAMGGSEGLFRLRRRISPVLLPAMDDGGSPVRRREGKSVIGDAVRRRREREKEERHANWLEYSGSQVIPAHLQVSQPIPCASLWSHRGLTPRHALHLQEPWLGRDTVRHIRAG